MTYVGTKPNKYGTSTSHHICETCGIDFTVCPAKEPWDEGWGNCMGDECPSYDPSRDADVLFMSDAEIAKEKGVVDIKFLRQRKEVEGD